MNVYLAAQYSWKEKIAFFASKLRAEGVTVTSGWLEEPDNPTTELFTVSEETRQIYAARDLADLDKSDIMVFFSIPDTELFKRGGRHVEFGYALAQRIPILVVGPKENIFHSLPNQVTHVDTWDEALAFLRYEARLETRATGTKV